MQSQIREAFRARLKSPRDGVSHRLTLIAWAYLRGKPYSFVEPRVRAGNVPSPAFVTGALFAVMAESRIDFAPDDPKGDKECEKIAAWMQETKGVIIERGGRPEPKVVIPKLYVIVRKDMPLGDVLCQAMHAALDFSHHHRDIFERWHKDSNTICVLEARDREHLNEEIDKLISCRRHFSLFAEPDMGHQTTAVAVEPSAAKLLRHLPLALS